MQVKDANGRGVGGQSIVLMASPGEVSAVTDQGGGRYVANVTAPAGVTGSLKVSAVLSSVNVATTLELPITGGGWTAVGTADQDTKNDPKPKKEKRVSWSDDTEEGKPNKQKGSPDDRAGAAADVQGVPRQELFLIGRLREGARWQGRRGSLRRR